MLAGVTDQYNLCRNAKTGSNPGLLRRLGSGNFPRFTKRVTSPFCCLIETVPQ
jgi:hypothetical protein